MKLLRRIASIACLLAFGLILFASGRIEVNGHTTTPPLGLSKGLSPVFPASQ